MGQVSVEEKVESDILLDSMIFGFKESFKDSFVPVKYVGSKLMINDRELSDDEVGLTDEEISLIYHGSDRINFRGALYLRESTESGINKRGEPVRRIKYQLHPHGAPPKF